MNGFWGCGVRGWYRKAVNYGWTILRSTLDLLDLLTHSNFVNYQHLALFIQMGGSQPPIFLEPLSKGRTIQRRSPWVTTKINNFILVVIFGRQKIERRCTICIDTLPVVCCATWKSDFYIMLHKLSRLSTTETVSIVPRCIICTTMTLAAKIPHGQTGRPGPIACRLSKISPRSSRHPRALWPAHNTSTVYPSFEPLSFLLARCQTLHSTSY